MYVCIYKTSLFSNLYDLQVTNIEDRKKFNVFIRRQNSFQMGTPRSLMQSSVVFRNSSRRKQKHSVSPTRARGHEKRVF